MNSRAKGARAEREVAEFLRDHGIMARRGQQFSGSPDSPDVIAEIPYHVEVKRVEAFQLWPAIEQAKRDSGGKPWVVFHRKNQKDWVCVLDAVEFVRLLKASGAVNIPAEP